MNVSTQLTLLEIQKQIMITKYVQKTTRILEAFIHEAGQDQPKRLNIKDSYFIGGTFCVDTENNEFYMFNLNGDSYSYYKDNFSIERIPLTIAAVKQLMSIYYKHKRGYLLELIARGKTIVKYLI